MADGRFLPKGNNPMLFDPYLDAVLANDKITGFANIEVQPVEELLDTDGFVEDYQVPSQSPTMFTVYLRYDQRVGFGGVIAAGDFGTASKARIFARAVHAFFSRKGHTISIVDLT